MKFNPKSKLNFSKQVTKVGYQKNLTEEERAALHSAMIEMKSRTPQSRRDADGQVR